MTGAKEQGTDRVRVINEPDVLVVAGGLAQGRWQGLLCLGREVEAADGVPALRMKTQRTVCSF